MHFQKLLDAVMNNKGIKVEKQMIQKDNTNSVEINLMFVGFAIMFMMFGLRERLQRYLMNESAVHGGDLWYTCQ